MKITKSYLKQVIKEELEASNENVNMSDDYGGEATKDFLKAQYEQPKISDLATISDPVNKIEYLKQIIEFALNQGGGAPNYADKIIKDLKLP